VNSIGATIDAGNNFEGQGQAVTIFLIPSDNSFASCTGSGASSNGCLFSAFSNLSNFTVTGAGFGATGNNSKTVIDPASHANFIHDLTLVAFGSGDTNLFGFAIPFSNKNDSVYVDQFGHIPCSFAGINTMSLSNSFCGDSSGPAAQAAGSGGTIRTTNVYFGQTTGTIQINLGGTNYTWYSTNDQSYGSVGAGGAQFYCNGAGDTYHISGFISLNPALGIDLNQATCKAYVRDSVIIGSTNSLSTQGVALTTGGYFNEGGNTYTGAFTASMQPSCPTVTGAGASGSCAMSGTAFNDSGTLRITVAGAGPAALGTVTMNFIGTFPNPSCQFTPALTGGGVWNARATVFISTRSNTAPVITWDNNGAALTATTWDIDYTCTSK
jgi:hypothetical protein